MVHSRADHRVLSSRCYHSFFHLRRYEGALMPFRIELFDIELVDVESRAVLLLRVLFRVRDYLLLPGMLYLLLRDAVVVMQNDRHG